MELFDRKKTASRNFLRCGDLGGSLRTFRLARV